MKHILIIMIAVAAFGFKAKAGNDKYDTVKIQTSAECDMCKQKIEKTLAFEKGVKSSDLDIETMLLTVIYRPDKTDVDKIRQAVSKAGYDADHIKADPKAYDKLPACCKVGAHTDDH